MVQIKIENILKTMLENVRKKQPLIHNITNFVTANDCANVLLACGGSPIMAMDEDEVEEITSICAGLNINIGTLNQRTVPAMLGAGKKANALGHPVVLDPVGAGASKLRTETALRLIENMEFAVIRGNTSEIKTLYRRMSEGKDHTSAGALIRTISDAGDEDIFHIKSQAATGGVDASMSDQVTEEKLPQAVALAKSFAAKTGAVIAMTGAIDIVADAHKAYCIYNGHPMMQKITGTGCQLSSVTAAYVAANKDTPLEAAAAAVCMLGVCGEKACARLEKEDGNATYHNYIIDAVYNLTGEELEKMAKIHPAL